jgi:flagellar basal-body rod modification protein FlgD
MSSAINAAVAAATSSASSGATAKGMAALGSDDFLKLMLAELTNQDPLEPMKNQDLMNEISSIRNLESQNTLVKALEALQTSGQLGSAGGLIGKQVSGVSSAGASASGTVDAVRIVEGKVVLRLADGSEVPFDQLIQISAPTT